MLQFLVVDDDEHVADVLKTGLEEYCGVSVTCVDSGAIATRVLENDPPDLAVIDVMLPDMSGLELAGRAADRKVPVLLISGHLDLQDASEMLDCPILAKPFSLRTLADAATTAVRDLHENIARLHRSRARLQEFSGDTQRFV